MPERIVSGFSIVATPQAFFSRPPPTVTVHRMGCTSTWHTPAEARALAAAINAAADEAEGKTPA